jgi:hypothetical protein
MADFRILQSATNSFLRFTSNVTDAHLVDDVAHLAASQTKGVTNPGYIFSFGHIGQPALWSKTTSQVVRGTGASALDDAVRALQELGSRHGIDGISLSTNPNQYGGLKLASTSLYESGGKILKQVGAGDVEAGRAIAFDIDAAARRVLDFIPS